MKNGKKVRKHITKALDALDMNLKYVAIEEIIKVIGFMHDDLYSLSEKKVDVVKGKVRKNE